MSDLRLSAGIFRFFFKVAADRFQGRHGLFVVKAPDFPFGDTFRRDGSAVREIGNNVTLSFDAMDFDDACKAMLKIHGSTPLNVNAITVRMTGENGKAVNEIADFAGEGGNEQEFLVNVPGGMCNVSFVFLPGCRFDFEWFSFKKLDSQTEMK